MIMQLLPIKLFKDPQYNDERVHYLYTYHPYRGGTNPKFDEASNLILRLKDGKTHAIQHFFNLLDPMLSVGFPIVVVPSGDPAKTDSGIRQLAVKLAQNNRIDATSCLIRLTQVPKKSHGGSRAIEVDLGSTDVVDRHLIRGKNVLLLDDVRTSGNSLEAGARKLMEAGALSVKQFSLAQTE